MPERVGSLQRLENGKWKDWTRTMEAGWSAPTVTTEGPFHELPPFLLTMVHQESVAPSSLLASISKSRPSGAGSTVENLTANAACSRGPTAWVDRRERTRY
jgi:hypothetical protein